MSAEEMKIHSMAVYYAKEIYKEDYCDPICAPEIHQTIVDYCKGAMDYRLSMLENEASDKWVSVDDKEPEEGQRVLILTDNKTVLTAKFSNRHSVKGFERDCIDHVANDRMQIFTWSNIKYWQPLPTSPKQ